MKIAIILITQFEKDIKVFLIKLFYNLLKGILKSCKEKIIACSKIFFYKNNFKIIKKCKKL